MAPVILKFKVAVCLRKVLIFCNNEIFPLRFESSSAKVTKGTLKKTEYKSVKKVMLDRDRKGEPVRFNVTPAYLMTHKNQFESFNRLLFQEQRSSIYTKMYQLENDYFLQEMIH